MKKIFLTIIITAVLGLTVFSQFTQEALPYAYKSLEPYIDAQTMEIHYTKHHQAYINNLNKALEVEGIKLKNENLKEIFEKIGFYNQAVRNNAGGHYNHTFFWSILSPKVDQKPSAHLANDIDKTFGSLDKFKELFIKEGVSQFGSGWLWLVVTTENRLVIATTTNQDNPLMEDVKVKGTPILGIDLWEHAYYLKYQNRRAEYLEAVWHVINWEKVSELYIDTILSK